MSFQIFEAKYIHSLLKKTYGRFPIMLGSCSRGGGGSKTVGCTYDSCYVEINGILEHSKGTISLHLISKHWFQCLII